MFAKEDMIGRRFMKKVLKSIHVDVGGGIMAFLKKERSRL